VSGSARLRLGTAGWLLLCAAIAFAARVGLTYHAVFGHDTIRFIESDAWYHMRLVDATVRQFPSRLWFDPYGVHPTGEPVDAGPFFDWIVAGSAVALGLGSPSPHPG
jgi:asparagine N-glycosylation enzyme membrane subunit Stt3